LNIFKYFKYFFMKSFIFLVLSMLGFALQQSNAQAHSYKAFEWELLNVGYAWGELQKVSAKGVNFGTELRFNATDNLAIGAKLSAAFLGTDVSGADIGYSGGYLLTGDYNFVDGYQPIRLFAGGQIGYLHGASINGSTVTAGATKGLGYGPRVGVEFGHARVTAQYVRSFAEYAPSYFSVSLGIVLWGGERN
jgi:hypothetical protein